MTPHRRSSGRGQGWPQESRRHSDAAKRGWMGRSRRKPQGTPRRETLPPSTTTHTTMTMKDGKPLHLFLSSTGPMVVTFKEHGKTYYGAVERDPKGNAVVLAGATSYDDLKKILQERHKIKLSKDMDSMMKKR